MLDALVGGWQLTSTYASYSGRFLTAAWTGPDPVGTAYTTSSTPAVVTIRPNQVSSPNLSSDQQSRQPLVQCGGVHGADGRIMGEARRAAPSRARGTSVLNAGIAKYFAISDWLRLRVEASATNLANHPNYTDPATNISSASQVGRDHGSGRRGRL